MRLPVVGRVVGRVVGPWVEDPLWATTYDWLVEHENVGGVLWRLGTGSSLADLYAAADEIGRLPAGSRVLDVPCGGGVALRGLRRDQGVAYVAADISPAMLDRTVTAAARRGVLDQLRTAEEDLLDLSFPDDSFDLVVSLTGLHVVPDPVRAVRELGRVLKPGGRLTGSALVTDTGRRFDGLRAVGRLAGVLGPSLATPDLLDAMSGAGLTRLRVETRGAFVYFQALKTR